MSRHSPTPRTLRTHLLVSMLVVASLPLLAVGIFNEYSAWTTHRNGVEQSLRNHAETIQRRTDDYIHKHVDALDALIGSVPEGNRRDPRAWLASLQNYRDRYRGFLTMLVTDKSGGILAETSLETHSEIVIRPGRSVADRQYFQRAISSGSPYVSAAISGRRSHDPLVALSRGFTSGAEGPAGIVEGSLDLRRLGQLAESYDEGGQFSIVITDATRHVVWAEPSAGLKVLDDLSRSLLLNGSAAMPPDPRDRSRSSPLQGEFLIGRSSGSHYGWQVVVAQPVSALRNSHLQHLVNVAITLVLSSGLCFLLARLLADRITRPLTQLAANVVNIADAAAETGHLIAKPAKNVPREVAQLAVGLEHLATRLRISHNRLRDANASLEARVAERTSDLEQINGELKAAIRCREETESVLLLRQRAMDASNQGIAIIDATRPDVPVVYVNKGFEHTTGYSADEVLGRDPAFLHGPKTSQETRAQLHSALAEGKPCLLELIQYRKDGVPFWGRLSVTPVTDTDGRLTHFICVGADITEARELDRIKTELISTVNHELRTPLTSLRGFAEIMLAREYPPERRRQFLNIIKAESTRLTGLIDDFLDIQRIENQKEPVRSEDFDIGGLLDEAVRLHQDLSGKHPIILKIADRLPLVRAERARIRQVADNLIGNAVKFYW